MQVAPKSVAPCSSPSIWVFVASGLLLDIHRYVWRREQGNKEERLGKKKKQSKNDKVPTKKKHSKRIG